MNDILLDAEGKPLVIQKDGKPIFVGKEDPSNPPIVARDPNSRTCSRCHMSADNSKEQCPHCGSYYEDSKMQCQVCLKWFDYLLGEDGNGGKQGCEAHWKPPTEKGGGHEPKTSSAQDIPFD